MEHIKATGCNGHGVSLGACGTAGDRKQEQSLRGQASAISGDADANAADASYRDEIAKIKNSGSTEAAQILEDGKITEEELVQLGSSYAQCLTSKGITVDTGEARYPGGSISPSYGDNALDKRNLSEDEIAATSRPRIPDCRSRNGGTAVCNDSSGTSSTAMKLVPESMVCPGAQP